MLGRSSSRCSVREFQIGSHKISDDRPAYVVAELGQNHRGCVETACEMIRVAAACGANAVKLQKRENRSLYSPAMRQTPYAHEHSYGATYGDHRDALEFDRLQFLQCQFAAAPTCPLFATAFDEASADFLADRGVPALKIASGGMTDAPLLRHVAGLHLPVILSTGGGTADDIDRAVNLLSGKVPLALLHCTAAYPVTDFAELNLRCIVTLRERYPDLVIGWSGHDVGIGMALVAYTLGARIIEKHFTLDRAWKGTDQSFSLEPRGLTNLVRDLKRAHLALGDGVKRFYPSELGPISKMRRWFVNGKWQIGTLAEQTPKVHA